MTDNKKKKKPIDSSKISLKESYEVTYWCGKFGCTKTQLTNAVKAVGHSASAVRKHFGNKNNDKK